MTAALALVERELRGLARQGQLFWVRVASGGVAILGLALILLQDVVVGAGLGQYLFAQTNRTLYFTILVIGPFITADCIAQEKREGTLGLLFLTPLSSLEIVLGKAAVNAVRGLTIVVAALPITIFPVLWGGVTSGQMLQALLSQLAAICLALCAGILASTRHREWLPTVVWAEIYCLVMLAGMTFITLLVSAVFRSVSLLVSAVFRSVYLVFVVVMLGLVLSAIILRAARQLKPLWEKQEATFAAPAWLRELVNPQRAASMFTWDTRQARNQNPIAWLQEYTPTARLAKWGWCLLVLAVEILVISSSFLISHDRGLQFGLGTILTLGLSLTAANSFRAERLNGAIELLLVTPIPPWKLILGRLWGAWVHFFPAVSILFLMWLGTASVLKSRSEFSFLLLSSYLFVPAIGLYLSMFPWNILVAWGAVFAIGVLLPFCVAIQVPGQALAGVMIGCGLQAVLAVGALVLLYRKLQDRAFCFR
jgi:ABC-type transport system involved in multi-copper enzyme maturation permease subunit